MIDGSSSAYVNVTLISNDRNRSFASARYVMAVNKKSKIILLSVFRSLKKIFLLYTNKSLFLVKH